MQLLCGLPTVDGPLAFLSHSLGPPAQPVGAASHCQTPRQEQGHLGEVTGQQHTLHAAQKMSIFEDSQRRPLLPGHALSRASSSVSCNYSNLPWSL